MYVPIEQWPNKELSKSQQLIPKLCHPRNWHETSQINDICKVLKWLSVLPVWYFVWVPIKASVPMGNEILQYKYPCYVTVYRCIDITFSLYDFYISNDCKLQFLIVLIIWCELICHDCTNPKLAGLGYGISS